MEAHVGLLISSIFVENLALSFFLGMCTFLAVSKKIETAIGLGAAVIVVQGITVPVNNLINAYLLAPGALTWAGLPDVDLSFLGFISFIGVIAQMRAGPIPVKRRFWGSTPLARRHLPHPETGPDTTRYDTIERLCLLPALLLDERLPRRFGSLEGGNASFQAASKKMPCSTSPGSFLIIRGQRIQDPGVGERFPFKIRSFLAVAC